jgi:DNA modification methylase
MFTQQVIQGDCKAVLQALPNESVDFVLTDPPYFVRYKDRSGRSIANDVDPASVLGAFVRTRCRVR